MDGIEFTTYSIITFILIILLSPSTLKNGVLLSGSVSFALFDGFPASSSCLAGVNSGPPKRSSTCAEFFCLVWYSLSILTAKGSLFLFDSLISLTQARDRRCCSLNLAAKSAISWFLCSSLSAYSRASFSMILRIAFLFIMARCLAKYSLLKLCL